MCQITIQDDTLDELHADVEERLKTAKSETEEVKSMCYIPFCSYFTFCFVYLLFKAGRRVGRFFRFCDDFFVAKHILSFIICIYFI